MGHTVGVCCEPKTCQQIKETMGVDTCPGNINTRIYASDNSSFWNPGFRLNKVDKGLNLCFKNLDETIPVEKLGGNQWEQICCGPSKIRKTRVEAVDYRQDYGEHGWYEPAYNTYQFEAGRCDNDGSWTKSSSSNVDIINSCHDRQALDLPGPLDCPSDDDDEQETIYDTVYLDTFIKSENGWDIVQVDV